MTSTALQHARRLRRARGISLVTAIFLLVVLSGLGVAIVTVSTTQQQSSVIDLLGTQAYEAARTGAEYGMYRYAQGGACASADFAGPGGLAAMTISVRCAQSSLTMTDGSTALTTQTRITATACNQPVGGVCPNPAPGVDYVQRVVQAVF